MLEKTHGLKLVGKLVFAYPGEGLLLLLRYLDIKGRMLPLFLKSGVYDKPVAARYAETSAGPVKLKYQLKAHKGHRGIGPVRGRYHVPGGLVARLLQSGNGRCRRNARAGT